MSLTSLMRPIDHVRFVAAADWLAVAAVISVPWSTSASSILFASYLVALVPTLDWADVRRELSTPAGGLPVLLVVLGMLGMLWADVSLYERWGGVTSFFKLLLIPLMFVHFRRSERGWWVFGGFLASCIVLLVLSTFIHDPHKIEAVLVKNGATQSGEFVICISGMLYLMVECIERRRWWWFIALVAATLGMLANMAYVATGRTALVVFPVLLVLFAIKKLSVKGIAALSVCTVLVAAGAWFSSPYLRDRTVELWTGYEAYRTSDALTSSGQRMAFYLNSLRIIREAPIVGHGTGTIGSLFAREIKEQHGEFWWQSNNPHNQTFAVAIQIGLVGALVLWAMWIAHLWLFRGDGLAEWIGLVLVTQNIIGSLFNSHLFDFVQGWIYVLGVGVAGGMVLKRRMAP